MQNHVTQKSLKMQIPARTIDTVTTENSSNSWNGTYKQIYYLPWPGYLTIPSSYDFCLAQVANNIDSTENFSHPCSNHHDASYQGEDYINKNIEKPHRRPICTPIEKTRQLNDTNCQLGYIHREIARASLRNGYQRSMPARIYPAWNRSKITKKLIPTVNEDILHRERPTVSKKLHANNTILMH